MYANVNVGDMPMHNYVGQVGIQTIFYVFTITYLDGLCLTPDCVQSVFFISS